MVDGREKGGSRTRKTFVGMVDMHNREISVLRIMYEKYVREICKRVVLVFNGVRDEKKVMHPDWLVVVVVVVVVVK